MRLDEIVELFAEDHKDFAHNPSATAKPAEKAFYRIDTINEQNEFCRNFNTSHSPAIAYSNLADGEMTNGKAENTVTIYFMQKVKGGQSKTQKQDDEQSFMVRESLFDYVVEFIAWLCYYKRLHPDTFASLGIDIDKIGWGGIPMKYNGWWLVGIQVTKVTPVNKCLVKAHFKSFDESGE